MRKVAFGAAVFVAAAITFVGGEKAHAQTEDTKPEPQMVVVQPGDSLSKIGTEHDTTYQRLFYANTEIEDPDLIYPGDEVRIPRPDEDLAERPIPGNAPAAQAAQIASPQPQAQPQPAPAPAVATGSVWDSLAQCESGGNWHINTGNGYYGGLQFSLSTWRSVGGSGYPHQASREEQIRRGQTLQARSGWGQWPACSAKLGLR